MNLESRIVKKEYVSHAYVDNEVVITNLKTNAFYRVNSIGADIWECLDDCGTLREVCEFIQARYNIDFEQCVMDVSRFLGGMARQDIIGID